MELEELDALIASHAEELREVSKSNLTVKFLGELLQNMQSITERLLDANPVMEHHLKFKRKLNAVMLPIQGATSKLAAICQAVHDHSFSPPRSVPAS